MRYLIPITLSSHNFKNWIQILYLFFGVTYKQITVDAWNVHQMFMIAFPTNILIY